MSQTSNYHGFKDITIEYAEDHYNAPKIHFKSYTWFAESLEDYLWNEFQYNKYGESYEEGVVGDEVSDETEQEFDTWIRNHSDTLYEWLENAIQAQKEDK